MSIQSASTPGKSTPAAPSSPLSGESNGSGSSLQRRPLCGDLLQLASTWLPSLRVENPLALLRSTSFDYDDLRAFFRTVPGSALIQSRAVEAALHEDFELLPNHGLTSTFDQLLTPTKFYQLYDPTQPTLGIVLPSSFCGLLFVGMAAAKLREQGRVRPNIVLLPPLITGQLSLEGSGPSGSVYTRFGTFIDSQGGLYSGCLPGEPIKVDLVGWFGLANSKVVDDLTARGISLFNSAEARDIFGDKGKTKEVARLLGIRVPEGIVVRNDSIDWEGQVETFISAVPATSFILKPCDASCGRDVYIFPRAEVLELRRSLADLLQRYDQLIVEERIESYPLFNEKGERLDWNIRFLLGPNSFVGWEARVAPYGEVVNKSRGAEVWAVTELLGKLKPTGNGEFPPKEGELFASLYRSALTLSKRLDARYVGYDFIGSVLLEGNTGNVGGLGSLFEIGRDDQERWAAPKRFLADLLLDLWSIRETAIQAPSIEGYEISHRGSEGREFRLELIDWALKLDFEGKNAGYLGRIEELLHSEFEEGDTLDGEFTELVSELGQQLTYLGQYEQVLNLPAKFGNTPAIYRALAFQLGAAAAQSKNYLSAQEFFHLGLTHHRPANPSTIGAIINTALTVRDPTLVEGVKREFPKHYESSNLTKFVDSIFPS